MAAEAFDYFEVRGLMLNAGESPLTCNYHETVLEVSKNFTLGTQPHARAVRTGMSGEMGSKMGARHDGLLPMLNPSRFRHRYWLDDPELRMHRLTDDTSCQVMS